MGYILMGLVFTGIFTSIAWLVHFGYASQASYTVQAWWKDTLYGFVPGLILMVCIVGIASLSIYVGGNNSNAQLEAFYFANVAHLALAEDKLLAGIDGSLENSELYFLGYDAQQAGHITVYASRVSINLEEIKDYNVKLLKRYKWQDSFWQGIFMPNVHKDLKLVRVLNQ